MTSSKKPVTYENKNLCIYFAENFLNKTEKIVEIVTRTVKIYGLNCSFPERDFVKIILFAPNVSPYSFSLAKTTIFFMHAQ